MAPRTVRVRLYSTAREAARRAFVDVPVPPSGIPVPELVRRLGVLCPGLGPVLRASRFVRNDRYLLRLAGRVRPGDRFAVHPPYGGG